MELKEFFNSSVGEEVKDWLLLECKKINNIHNVPEHSSAAAQAIEFKATKKAAQILKDIFSKIMTLKSLGEKVVKDNYT